MCRIQALRDEKKLIYQFGLTKREKKLITSDYRESFKKKQEKKEKKNRNDKSDTRKNSKFSVRKTKRISEVIEQTFGSNLEEQPCETRKIKAKKVFKISFRHKAEQFRRISAQLLERRKKVNRKQSDQNFFGGVQEEKCYLATLIAR